MEKTTIKNIFSKENLANYNDFQGQISLGLQDNWGTPFMKKLVSEVFPDIDYEGKELIGFRFGEHSKNLGVGLDNVDDQIVEDKIEISLFFASLGTNPELLVNIDSAEFTSEVIVREILPSQFVRLFKYLELAVFSPRLFRLLQP